ncbi:MAG: baseplate protein J [Anaerolineaceae bacterium]|nr:baseplate protein J [Anaerolineaceae bacterium]
MPIQLPTLDDKTYADLVESSLKLIPGLNSDWTNFNSADPGITLIELFAWLTEMVLFRADQIPVANTHMFLRLLNEPGWQPPAELTLENTPPSVVESTLKIAIRDTLLNLRKRYRVVTSTDYETLVLLEWASSTMATAVLKVEPTLVIQRVSCVPLRDLTGAKPIAYDELKPAHLSLVVAATRSGNSQLIYASDAVASNLAASILKFLDERRLLTTRPHVVLPKPLMITITATLIPDSALYDAQKLTRDAQNAITAIFDPLTGGKDHQGWPFGRDIYVSEIYELLDRLTGVDYVTALNVSTQDNSRQQFNIDGQLVGLSVYPDEVAVVTVNIVFPTGEA